MKRTTLLTAVLAIAVVATATPALAMRDPGAGGMAMYNYGPQPPRIGQAGLNNQYADGMNLYQYAGSNPVNWVDPTGLIKGKGKYCDCGTNDKNAWKTVDINPVILQGSTATLGPDFRRANEAYEQCCIKIKNGGTTTWYDDLTEKAIGKDRILDEFTSVGTPTAEEVALTRHKSPNILSAYYVKGLSQRSRGESFWFSAWKSPPAPAIVIGNSKAVDTFAHEIGHVLLDNGGHNADADNLMASGAIRNFKDLLTETQCDKLRKSRLVK